MEKQYNCLLSDPPWQYDNKNTGGSLTSGASAKYPTMSTEEICKLVPPSAKNSVLFLWVTVPFLPDGLQVMKAWNFKYKTMITWEKTGRTGLGYWWRGQTEHLLFGVRGKVTPFRMQEANIRHHPVGIHSAKPEIFRNMINRAADKGGLNDRLEMFARRTAPGWDAFGNQVENSIIL